MDCEKFDAHVIDELYDELDEVTHAAMKRHTDGCSRCSAILLGLRATREVGIIPIEEPSDDLEARILAAAAATQKKAPWHRKAVRAIAWAGSHAMRPQLAMAAVLVLMLGSSLLLLRAKPGTVGVAPVRVTERGVPEPDRAESVVERAAATAAPAPMAAATASAPIGLGAAEGFESEPDRKRAHSIKGEADRDEAGAAASKDKDLQGQGKEAADGLAEARAAKSRSGCEAAVGKYDDVGSRFPRTSSAAVAMWEAAECYKSMGEGAKAREIYMALRSVDGYRERADGEIATTEAASNGPQQNLGAPGGAGNAAAARPAPAAPAKARMATDERSREGSAPPATSPPASAPASSPGTDNSKKATSKQREADAY